MFPSLQVKMRQTMKRSLKSKGSVHKIDENQSRSETQSSSQVISVEIVPAFGGRRRRLTWTCSAMSPVWAASMSANFLKVLLWTTQLTPSDTEENEESQDKKTFQSRDYRASKLMIQQGKSVKKRNLVSCNIIHKVPRGSGFLTPVSTPLIAKGAPRLKAWWTH